MPDNTGPNPVQIHKYPNRRYYDTFNSRHVTLQDLHDLIISGKDICVTDTRTGEDLTNVVLMQILLERDHPKLDLFPSSIMHMVIRSNRKMLRDTLERFFGPFLGIVAATQKQFDSYFRETMKGRMVSPLDWTNEILRTFGGPIPSRTEGTGPGPSEAQPPPFSPRDGDFDDLRTEINALRRQIEGLKRASPRGRRKKK